jgi:hypothetical protein
MAIQHKNITEADLHEPKGVSTASVGKVYISDGAGSGSWIYSNAHGSVAFSNVAAPTSITYPSVYTKVLVTTTASGIPIEFTEATTARLTYTGTLTRPVRLTGSIYIDQSSGANRNVRAALYKNGSIITLTENLTTIVTGSPVNVVLSADINLSTNDYIEIYIKNDGASGDVRVYNLWLAAITIGRS